MSGDTNGDPKLNYLISNLQKIMEDRINWLQRKEVAIWSAAALYLAGLTYTFSFFFANRLSFIQLMPDFILLILVAIVLLIFSLIFFAFIHANFGSIYFSQAASQTLIILISEIIEKNLTYSQLIEEKPYPNNCSDKANLTFSQLIEENQCQDYYSDKADKKNFVYPDFIHYRINERLYKNQLFKKKRFRVIKLIFSLLTLQWGAFGSKLENSIARQEASIYSIIVFSDLCFLTMVCIVLFLDP